MRLPERESVIASAIRLLETPSETHAEVAQEQLETTLPGAFAPLRDWLLLLGALAFATPAWLTSRMLVSLSRSVARVANDAEARLAGAIFCELFGTYLATSAWAVVTELLGGTGHSQALYEALSGAVTHAAVWKPELLSWVEIADLADLEHLRSQRHVLTELAFHRFLTVAPSLTTEQLQQGETLFAETWHGRYTEPVLRAYGVVRESAPVPVLPLGEELRIGARDVLLVYNINSGQGDEIIRCVLLVQALLDGNPELRVTVVATRPYLFSHPCVKAMRAADAGEVARIWTRSFDAVIDFYQPAAAKPSDEALEDAVQKFIEARPPRLWIWTTNNCDRLLFDRVIVDGVDYAGRLLLNKDLVDSVYDATFRLLADLGLPLRFGERRTQSEPVLAGLPLPEDHYLRPGTAVCNRTDRPVAIFNPFGGYGPLKGYSETAEISAEIGRLIDEGYFVVVMPNGTAWGSAGAVKQSIARLPPGQRDFAMTGFQPTDDAAMSRLLWWIREADLTVTVEGWMMHAADCLARPYRILMLPYSGLQKWFPLGRSPRQQVQTPALMRRWVDSSNHSQPHIPRRAILQVLLSELGRHAGEAARPILERALATADRYLRASAAEGLVCLGRKEDLEKLLLDDYRVVRATGAQAALDQKMRPHGWTKEQLKAFVWIGGFTPAWEPVIRLGSPARLALELCEKDEDRAIRWEAKQILRILVFPARRTRGWRHWLRLRSAGKTNAGV